MSEKVKVDTRGRFFFQEHDKAPIRTIPALVLEVLHDAILHGRKVQQVKIRAESWGTPVHEAGNFNPFSVFVCPVDTDEAIANGTFVADKAQIDPVEPARIPPVDVPPAKVAEEEPKDPDVEKMKREGTAGLYMLLKVISEREVRRHAELLQVLKELRGSEILELRNSVNDLNQKIDRLLKVGPPDLSRIMETMQSPGVLAGLAAQFGFGAPAAAASEAPTPEPKPEAPPRHVAQPDPVVEPERDLSMTPGPWRKFTMINTKNPDMREAYEAREYGDNSFDVRVRGAEFNTDSRVPGELFKQHVVFHDEAIAASVEVKPEPEPVPVEPASAVLESTRKASTGEKVCEDQDCPDRDWTGHTHDEKESAP